MITPDSLMHGHGSQEASLRSFLDLARTGEEYVGPVERYLFLCFTNRCGSDLLSQAMASSGRLPESLEPFNIDTTRQVCGEHGIRRFEDYFTFQARQQTRCGWFCAKLALGQLLFLNAVGVLDAIMSRSSFILLERNDKIAQAISRRLAWQTRRWTSQQTSAVADDALIYDRAAIDSDLAALNRQNAGFRLFFNANGVTPIHISYEALVGELDATVREIGGRLGISPLTVDRSKIVVKKLDDRVQSDWRQRYLAGR